MLQGSGEVILGGFLWAYNYEEIVGTSATSWDDAAVLAVGAAQERNGALRVAQVVEMDHDLTGDVMHFRTKLSVSYEYPTN